MAPDPFSVCMEFGEKTWSVLLPEGQFKSHLVQTVHVAPVLAGSPSLLKTQLDNLPRSSTRVSNWLLKLTMVQRELHAPSQKKKLPSSSPLHLCKRGHHLPTGLSRTRCKMCGAQGKMKCKSPCTKITINIKIVTGEHYTKH